MPQGFTCFRISNSDAQSPENKSLRKCAKPQEQRFIPGGDQCYFKHGRKIPARVYQENFGKSDKTEGGNQQDATTLA